MDNLGYPFFIQRTRSAPADFYHLERIDLADRGEVQKTLPPASDQKQKKDADANNNKMRIVHEAGNQFW
jgi:hypothetical protein